MASNYEGWMVICFMMLFFREADSFSKLERSVKPVKAVSYGSRFFPVH